MCDMSANVDLLQIFLTDAPYNTNILANIPYLSIFNVMISTCLMSIYLLHLLQSKICVAGTSGRYTTKVHSVIQDIINSNSLHINLIQKQIKATQLDEGKTI